MGEVRVRLARANVLALALASAPTAACLEPEARQAPIVFRRERIPSLSLETVLRPGTNEQSVQVGGQLRRFMVVAPSHVTFNHPLIVYLHGAMRVRGPTGQRRVGIGSHELLMRCLFEREFAALRPVILMPVSPFGTGGEWWTETETSFVIALVDAVKRAWPIDTARTIVAGYSNGGIGAWTLARLYPERFSAAIPMAFDVGAVGATRIPIFAIQGTKDELFDYQAIAEDIKLLQDRGQPITFVGKYRGSHFGGCDYASEVAQAREWLTSSVWSQ
jgi:poly(3-hydroxybutyrate) depolymerase